MLSKEQREKYLEILRKCLKDEEDEENSDIEGNHRIADMVLTDALLALGEKEIVQEWEKLEKWYA